MSNTKYQTFTEDTPIDIYREDFLRRSALCAALSKRYPALAPIGLEAKAKVAEIDTKTGLLRRLQDDLICAKALEDAEKLDVVEAYAEMRKTMSAKKYDYMTLAPDAPSSLSPRGPATFIERVNLAMANIHALPDGDGIKTAFMPVLEGEYAEFQTADKAEDQARIALSTAKMALTLFKMELAEAREAQLGAIQAVVKDRAMVPMFTIPWRKPAKKKTGDEEDAGEAGSGPPA